MELSIYQKAAIVQAMHSVTAQAASTKEPESIRSQFDSAMLDGYRADGTKSRDIILNGEKIGSATVRMSKPKTTERVRIEDSTAYMEWACDNDLVTCTVDEKRVLEHVHATGELPEGATVVAIEEPARPLGTLLKTDPPAVARACRAELPGIVTGALEGGFE